ncbi:hypothetical protein ABES02_29085 [Neobacillus pocheonensis]|uniref:hypothetical protein n=1 Tax=Neobacillus pocheonensis TaxID=363869 RepID=UPI003D28CD24
MANDKATIYLDILLSAGPHPSDKGLKKVFDLMGYSSDQRSEIMVLFNNARRIFFDESKGYISINGLMLDFKACFCFTGIIFLLGTIFSLLDFQYAVLYSLIPSLIIIFVLTIKYKLMRPIYEESIWRRSVQKALNGASNGG